MLKKDGFQQAMLNKQMEDINHDPIYSWHACSIADTGRWITYHAMISPTYNWQEKLE